MTNLVKKISALVLVAAMSVMAGCAATGMGNADSALMNDVLTERQVIRALFAEPNLTGNAISVGCVDGIITLSGSVEDESDRQLAERVAKGVSGVTNVQNNLKTS